MNKNDFRINILSRYDDIGKKIKNIAIGQSILFMISSWIIGFILIIQGDLMIVWGLVVIVVGTFCSSISTYILYGFGQLIDKVCYISDAICDNRDEYLDSKIKYVPPYNDNDKDNAKDVDLEKNIDDDIFTTNFVKVLLIIIAIVLLSWFFIA